MHTAEIQLQIDFSTFQMLIKNIPSIKHNQDGKTISNYYSGKGIRQIELMKYSYTDNTGCTRIKFYIILRLNISVIMGESGIGVLNMKNYTPDEIIWGLQQRLHEVNIFCQSSLNRVDIDNWKVIRVDLAKDVFVNDPAIYVFLSNLGVPYGHRKLKRANINKLPNVLYYESCCFGNKSKRINIYNKMAALINKGQVSYKVIPDIEHLLRIEYQLLKSSVRYNSSKWKDERSIRSYLDEKTVTNYLLSELISTFGTGRYVTHSLAVKLIMRSNQTHKEKSKMLRTIELIHQMDGLYNLELALTDKSSDLAKELGNLKTFREKRLAKIKKLGINPVVIPDEYGYIQLPGLFELILR